MLKRQRRWNAGSRAFEKHNDLMLRSESLPSAPCEARPDDKLRKRLEGSATPGLATILRDAAKTLP